MATTSLRPNGDATPNNWSNVSGCTLHHDCVDEVCSNPNTGCEDGNYLSESELGSGNQEDFNMDNPPASLSVCTSITPQIYGQSGPNGGNIGIQYSTNGGTIWSSTKYGTPPVFPALGWYTPPAPWSGLSLTLANMNAIQFRLTAATGAKLYSVLCRIFYVDITYTLVGWSQGDPMGVAIANVDSICGVSLSDIDEMKGV